MFLSKQNKCVKEVIYLVYDTLYVTWICSKKKKSHISPIKAKKHPRLFLVNVPESNLHVKA